MEQNSSKGETSRKTVYYAEAGMAIGAYVGDRRRCYIQPAVGNESPVSSKDKSITKCKEKTMNTNNRKGVPLGVLLISGFYVFGAVVLLISMVTNPAGVSRSIAEVHGLLPVMGVEILLAVAALAFAMAYGLLRSRDGGFS